MNKYILWILILATVLLAGCQLVGPVGTTPSGPVLGTTSPIASQPIASMPTEHARPVFTEPTEPVIPEGFPDDIDTDPAAVAMFQELFGDRTCYAQALLDSYDDPRDVNIPGLFEFGFADESPVTDEERAEIVNQTGYEDYSWLDGYRLPVDKMNAVLQALFGCTLDDMNMVGGHLKYLESTNCYYCLGGGSWYVGRINVVGTKNLEDGNIEVYYMYDDHKASMEGVAWGVVTLKPVEDGYHILSNRWFE